MHPQPPATARRPLRTQVLASKSQLSAVAEAAYSQLQALAQPPARHHHRRRSLLAAFVPLSTLSEAFALILEVCWCAAVLARARLGAAAAAACTTA
jgi:hypothetical protein